MIVVINEFGTIVGIRIDGRNPPPSATLFATNPT
jgi:hypothetical protein